MSEIFDCIRINRSGENKRYQFSKEDSKEWLQKNQKLYPNWAFMVNGKIEYNGNFTPTEIIMLEHQYLLYEQYKDITKTAFFGFDTFNFNFKI